MPVEGMSFRGQGQQALRNRESHGGGGIGRTRGSSGIHESVDLADEKRFQALRKRLADEGYTQTLGFESMPLVHRIFDDLFALRDTHATMAHNLSEKSANEAKLQRQIHPIQKELSRMVRENNQLHLELIQRSEELDMYQRKGALETKKLQTKITDQGFIITQQAQHIRDLERQVDDHRTRIQQILDPNFTYTSGPAGETLPKGQEIMVSACPRPHEADDEEDTEEQLMHDLESATAQQIAVLEEDLNESKRKQEVLELQVLSMQDAVRNRENEITRMGKLLINNVNSDKEDLEKINSGNEDTIRRLNSQLDFVSEQLADAEQQKMRTQQLLEDAESLRVNEAKLKSMLSSAQSEVRELRALLQQPAGPARTGGGIPTPAKAGPGGDMQQISAHAVDDVEHDQNSQMQDDEASNRQQAGLQVEELDALLRQRDSECSRLREQLVVMQQRLSESQSKSEQIGAELTEMKRLRDNLYAVVWDFENQMAEVQIKVSYCFQSTPSQIHHSHFDTSDVGA